MGRGGEGALPAPLAKPAQAPTFRLGLAGAWHDFALAGAAEAGRAEVQQCEQQQHTQPPAGLHGEVAPLSGASHGCGSASDVRPRQTSDTEQEQVRACHTAAVVRQNQSVLV